MKIEIIPDILQVYNPDLSIGWLDSIDSVDGLNPDVEYLIGCKWIFSTTQCNNYTICTSGWWERIELLIFVDDHEIKIKKITEFLSNNNEDAIDLNELIQVLTVPLI